MVARGRVAFEADKVTQVWVIHHLEIVGEAPGHVSADLRNANADVPWSQIVAMRNILVHEYSRIDVDAVWYAATIGLPDLKASLRRILNTL